MKERYPHNEYNHFQCWLTDTIVATATYKQWYRHQENEQDQTIAHYNTLIRAFPWSQEHAWKWQMKTILASPLERQFPLSRIAQEE